MSYDSCRCRRTIGKETENKKEMTRFNCRKRNQPWRCRRGVCSWEGLRTGDPLCIASGDQAAGGLKAAARPQKHRPVFASAGAMCPARSDQFNTTCFVVCHLFKRKRSQPASQVRSVKSETSSQLCHWNCKSVKSFSPHKSQPSPSTFCGHSYIAHVGMGQWNHGNRRASESE